MHACMRVVNPTYIYTLVVIFNVLFFVQELNSFKVHVIFTLVRNLYQLADICQDGDPPLHDCYLMYIVIAPVLNTIERYI